ncbi:hypothetical protein OG988_40615 [Streptomyces zaomyceticus]|uniref:hypothetical protein n=1 Tax=Streptomyces zaomyceticus TaxID=68286 RepID=UPI003245DBAB
MGREKPNKPRKPRGETPRIIDMPNVSVETKKNAVLSCITEGEGPAWRMTHMLMQQRYGEFTVEERDLLDLPAQTRTDALNELAFYATAQMPAQAPMGAQEAAARAAANCRQALARLAPLVEDLD